MNPVLVSVVMPTYNDAPYLREAIGSILGQTYPHFEFIIVNDGSADETEDIISSYKDPRIRYYRNDINRGNNFTRNRGMELATGKYIAIMDSDDVSVPNRLEIQLLYLEKNPRVDILGGFTRSDYEGKLLTGHYAVDLSFLKAFLFLKNSVAQPTVMFRQKLLEDPDFRYDLEREYLGDYHLWYRSVRKGIVIKSIPMVLVDYRLSASQIGSIHANERFRKLKIFLQERLDEFGITLEENELSDLHLFLQTRIYIDAKRFSFLNQILDTIEEQNKKIGFAEHRSMKAAILFFRLRLIKYHYLENKRRRKFLGSLFKLLLHAGPLAAAEFWRNEGKYLIRKENLQAP